MKTLSLVVGITVGLHLLAGSLGAKDKPAPAPARAPVAKPTPSTAATPHSKEPWVKARVTFSDNERRVIQRYAQDCHEHEKRGHKGKGLPPGLAKKVARGGKLPPGWQKKCVRGQVMPEPVFRECHPLPREVVVKLPPPPSGTILVTIEGKVVRLARATREILDVFEVKM